MVDYTWVVNLLRELEIFANDRNLPGLSGNLALASAALISDTEDKAKIDPEARRWLEGAAAPQAEHGGRCGKNTVNFPRGAGHCLSNILAAGTRPT